jgi:hypothetical protein
LRPKELLPMVENKFFLLFVTLIWMSGLFSVLLTAAYILQERRRHRGFTLRIGSLPRILVPLYGSLAVFCTGLALHAYAAQNTVSLWMSLAWGGLALLFALRVISAISVGIRDGWDVSQHILPAPASGGKENGWKLLASGIALLLLVVNTLLATWWLRLQISDQTLAKSTPVLTVTTIGEVQPDQEPLLTAVVADATPLVQSVVTVAPATTAPTETVGLVTATVTSVISSVVTSTPPSTSLLTPPLTPTAIPETVIAVEPLLTVRSVGGANIRTSPDLGAEVLTISPEETVLPVVGRTADSQWYLVRVSNDVVGWISVLVVELPDDAVNIPVVGTNVEVN